MEITAQQHESPYIDIHTHTPEGDSGDVCNVVSLLAPDTEKLSGVKYYSAGLHPKDAEIFAFEDFIPLFKNALLIGETGLDRTLADSAPWEKQLEIFRRHAEYAAVLGKPLIIHAVRANEEIIRFKREFLPVRPWIIHGFRGNAKKALRYIEEGFHLSFGYGLLRDAGNAAAYFREIPLEKMFFETDSQADIKMVYALAASMLEVSVCDLKKHIENNFQKLINQI